MPQATYIRGTKFSSFWFEIKEFVISDSRLWVMVGMEHNPSDVGFHEELIMEINSNFVGKKQIDFSEVINLGDFFEQKTEEKDFSFIACLVKDDELLVVGKRGAAYLLRGENQGYILRKTEKVSAKKGKTKEGDKLFVGIGEGTEEAVSEISTQKLARQIEDDLEMPCCGMILEFDGLVDEQMENKIVLDGDKKSEEVSTNQKNKSNTWNKWKDHLKKRIDTANPEVYVKSDERKRLGRVVLLVFLLLVVSVGVGWRKRKVDQEKDQFNQIYEPSLELLVEAEGLVEESNLEAREKLIEAREKIEGILKDFSGTEKEKEKLSTLLSQVNDLYKQVSGEVEIDEAELFYDLSLVKEDVFGEEMSLADGWITVLDKSRGVVLGVEEKSKQAKLLAGGEVLAGAKMLSSSGGKAVVLANSGLVGVYYNDRTAEVLLETDEAWKNPVEMGMFGGNVYVMDAETSEVWRYPGFEGGLGSGVRWLGPGVTPDFSDAASVAVDGDIWVASSDRIRRFRRGALMNFSVEGLMNPLSKIEAIYTDTDSEAVYVLDRENERVVVFDKEGKYLKQYLWSGIKAADDMVIVEKEGGGIILLLSGSSIYQIQLEN